MRVVRRHAKEAHSADVYKHEWFKYASPRGREERNGIEWTRGATEHPKHRSQPAGRR
jgi:hypothetical protein